MVYLMGLPVRCPAATVVLVSVLVLRLDGQNWEDFRTPTPIGLDDTLVIGFLGGRERWDNDKRSPRRLALQLRSEQSCPSSGCFGRVITTLRSCSLSVLRLACLFCS